MADVRAKNYTGFEHLQGLNVSTPFGVFNANLDPLNRPHHSWVGKTTCCEQSDPFGNSCPEAQMSNSKRWDWCPINRAYVLRPKHDALTLRARGSSPSATPRSSTRARDDRSPPTGGTPPRSSGSDWTSGIQTQQQQQEGRQQRNRVNRRREGETESPREGQKQ